MRKNPLSLADKIEFQEIIRQEATRKLPIGKKLVHYPNLSLIIKLLNNYQIDSRLLLQNINPIDFQEKASNLINQLVPKILCDKQKNMQLLNQIYDYLSEEDKPIKSDIIFVFCSSKYYRINKAIDLYEKGYAPIIFVSGRSPIYKPNRKSEASIYEEHALKKGIPDNSIIVEDQSITIPDNVRRSLNLLDKLKIRYSSIILVNSPYVQRRGWCHFKKYLPDSVNLYRVNSLTKPKYNCLNWYKNEGGLRTVINEYFKMRTAVLMNTA